MDVDTTEASDYTHADPPRGRAEEADRADANQRSAEAVHSPLQAWEVWHRHILSRPTNVYGKASTPESPLLSLSGAGSLSAVSYPSPDSRYPEMRVIM